MFSKPARRRSGARRGIVVQRRPSAHALGRRAAHAEDPVRHDPEDRDDREDDRRPGAQLLDAQAEALLQSVAAVSGPVGVWRQALVGLIRSGRTQLGDLAQALQMSPRSLQRRLAEHGHSFQTLLNQTRQQLAEAYLRDDSVELAEVALLLGYSEQSAFTRAFRQWTGQAPLQWRRQQAR